MTTKVYFSSSATLRPTRSLRSAKESIAHKLIPTLDGIASEIMKNAWYVDSYELLEASSLESFFMYSIIELSINEVAQVPGNLPEKIYLRVPVAHRSNLDRRFTNDFKSMVGVMNKYPVIASEGISYILPTKVVVERAPWKLEPKSAIGINRLKHLLKPSKFWLANGELLLSDSKSSELNDNSKPSTELESNLASMLEMYSPRHNLINESLSSSERFVLDFFESSQSLLTMTEKLVDSYGGMFTLDINDHSLIGPGTTLSEVEDNEHASIILDVLLSSDDHKLLTIELSRDRSDKYYRILATDSYPLEFYSEFETIKLVGNVLREIHRIETTPIEELSSSGLRNESEDLTSNDSSADVDDPSESNNSSKLPYEFNEIDLSEDDLEDNNLISKDTDPVQLQRFQEDLEELVDSDLSEDDLKSSLIDRIKSRRN